ncbi:ABC transporter substrate-binding protein [Microbacterium sp. 1.5R]|uniref:ABC transporter substrate-binding protein n=1 Tax=Microbacterium sp. 1.5R TaxID=1916917 RepID=UPI0011A62DC8|nr:ABC transporter substrate-binding protein [Microbacterium sp. 1.5R]
MKRRTITLAAAATLTAAALALSGCAGGSDAPAGEATTGGELTVAVAYVPPKWDPATFDWGFQLQSQQAAYDTLIHLQPDGSFAPGLATAWEYTTPTEFTITVREGVTFTDDTPLDAAAVKANLEHAQSSGGPKSSQLAAVTSVDAPDDTTVVVTLSAPNPAMPFVLSQAMGMMASPAAIEAGTLDAAPVGAGPYTLDTAKTVVDDHYTFQKNPDYWDAENVALDTLTFRVIADTNAAFNAIRAGEVNLGVGTAQTLDAAKSGNVGILEAPGGVFSIVLQDREGTLVPALADQRVRQALNYAIDRESIADAVLPGRPTDQIFGPATDAYDESLDDYYDYDPEKAKKLMADAGYADGFTLPVLSTATFAAPLQAMTANLADIGVTVQIEDKVGADYIAARTSGEYPAYFGANTPTNAYIDAQNLILPTGALNPFKVTDQTMVDLWTEGAAQDDAERSTTYQEMSKQVVEQAWFIPLVQSTGYTYYRGMDGVEPTKGQVVPFINTWTATQ